MLRLRPILCFIIISDVLLSSLCFTMLGPADLIFKSFEGCEIPVEDISVKIAQKKFNRTTNVLDVIVVTPITLNNDLELELQGAVKKEGGYKPGGFYMKDLLCKVLSTMLGDLFREFLKVAGKDDCPLPEGKYEILEFYFNNDNFNVPQVYGEFKFKCSIFKGDQTLACYNLYIELVPKTKYS